MFEFWSLDNSSSKSILDVLETIYLKFRKPTVQRVTVIKLGTDTAKSTNVMVAGFRQCRYLSRKGKMFVKYEAKVARRLSIVSIEVEEL